METWLIDSPQYMFNRLYRRRLEGMAEENIKWNGLRICKCY